MPSAKAAYDMNGSRKSRNFSRKEWEDLEKRLQTNLRPFYPNKNAVVDPTWGHPADQWSNHLLSAAEGAVTTVHWHSRRLTNEELRAEQKDLLDKLKRTAERLATVSQDLNSLFDTDADLMGTRDKIDALIPHVEACNAKIASLPKAQTPKEANHAAAVEMAIRTMRVFKEAGGTVAATANTYSVYISDAVRILKIIGDELGLVLDETTWKRVVIKARNNASDLQ